MEVITDKSVIKSKYSNSFSTLHCESLHNMLQKDMKTHTFLCVICLRKLCPLLMRSNCISHLTHGIYIRILFPKTEH